MSMGLLKKFFKNFIPDDKLFALSDSLIKQNMEAYKELAK